MQSQPSKIMNLPTMLMMIMMMTITIMIMTVMTTTMMMMMMMTIHSVNNLMRQQNTSYQHAQYWQKNNT